MKFVHFLTKNAFFTDKWILRQRSQFNCFQSPCSCLRGLLRAKLMGNILFSYFGNTLHSCSWFQFTLDLFNIISNSCFFILHQKSIFILLYNGISGFPPLMSLSNKIDDWLTNKMEMFLNSILLFLTITYYDEEQKICW